MYLLVTTAQPSLYQHPDPDTGADIHANLGRLLTPRHYSSVEKTGELGIPWACDNDGFNGVHTGRMIEMLDRVSGIAGCRFISVPDVLRCAKCRQTVDGFGGNGGTVSMFAAKCGCPDRRLVYGDAALTAQRFDQWEARMRAAGQPLALVLQDGQDAVGVDWGRIDAVFVGGSDDFKLGPSAARWCREAKARGKWVHWGRVNSLKRIRYIISTGAADSCDGTMWARWRKTHLDKGLTWIRDVEAERLQEQSIAA